MSFHEQSTNDFGHKFLWENGIIFTGNEANISSSFHPERNYRRSVESWKISWNNNFYNWNVSSILLDEFAQQKSFEFQSELHFERSASVEKLQQQHKEAFVVLKDNDKSLNWNQICKQKFVIKRSIEHFWKVRHILQIEFKASFANDWSLSMSVMKTSKGVTVSFEITFVPLLSTQKYKEKPAETKDNFAWQLTMSAKWNY